MKRILFVIAAAALISCDTTTSKTAASVDSPAIQKLLSDTTALAKPALRDTFSINGAWFLQPVLASDTATGNIPTLIFNLDKNSFSGNTGCNNMNGSFQKTDTSLIFNEKIITTRMACPGYNEKPFVDNLLKANRFMIKDGVLQLMYNTTILSKWTRSADTSATKKA